MRGYRFLPDVAIADLYFEAFGKNYNQLFQNSALALESALVDLKTVSRKKVEKIKIEAYTLDELLFSFLEELIFLKDAQKLLFNKFVCKVKQLKDGRWKLESFAAGEVIKPLKHKLGVDVKAVTKHLFKVEKLSQNNYRCQVVLDI